MTGVSVAIGAVLVVAEPTSVETELTLELSVAPAVERMLESELPAITSLDVTTIVRVLSKVTVCGTHTSVVPLSEAETLCVSCEVVPFARVEDAASDSLNVIVVIGWQ
jgi:hypothetical protein